MWCTARLTSEGSKSAAGNAKRDDTLSPPFPKAGKIAKSKTIGSICARWGRPYQTRRISHHTSTLSANLECRSEMCCTRLAKNIGCKKSPFWHHRTTLSSSIFAAKEIGKKLLNIDISSTCPHNMVNFGLPTAEICWRVPCKFQRVSPLGSVTARQSNSGRQPNFAALNRGRHLCWTGRPLGIGPHF